MRYGRRIFFVLMLILALAVPAGAAQRVDKLPTITGYNAARFEIAFVFNGQLLIAGKGQMSSTNRIYMTLKSLPVVPGAPTETAEIVFYDGTLYVRENDDPQWYIEETGLPVNPPNTGGDIDTGGYPVTMIQTMPIAGVQTDQYQIWIAGETAEEYGKLDLWIGKQTPYLYQDQATLIANDPDLGELKLEEVYRFYDMGASDISVGRPANAKPRAASGFPGLRAPRGLRGLVAPIKASFIRDAALARFN